jgi:predicted enzyme related to lactoylglutathione lyase
VAPKGEIMKNKVVMFEIPSSDFKKRSSFDEAVFDWKVELYGDEACFSTAELEPR